MNSIMRRKLQSSVTSAIVTSPATSSCTTSGDVASSIADRGRLYSTSRWSGMLNGLAAREPSSCGGGEKSHTSMMVLPPRLAMMTAFSSSNTTLHTASAGLLNSRTRVPFLTSQTLTRPSLPPLTILVLSNCKLVYYHEQLTDESPGNSPGSTRGPNRLTRQSQGYLRAFAVGQRATCVLVRLPGIYCT
jgi:hypothetical protein